MAKCEICGKAPRRGIQLSHSHRKSKRTWAPNIFRVKADLNGRIKRINVCSSCLRSGKVKRAK
ncbi:MULTISPECIES: 50S ribosomal protein L28 [Tepidanaerobacter]|uniref:Large ribosomal subunit protein bL28 n=1 Tax=Tepidanaerobacter syntrophicus TaxID=224999 RepID=A0A0U9HL11_9FIRM|nr:MULTISPECIES: 50S ribosomal protein L28 [Tepidanaerobacter]GAQ26076.1 large subunit ribosomal protein L28 [Tepidanaerobacter syntrophicus]GLI19609.1 50S ribosomal protein L28 [Tepidanaerobacter syntrophicus]GLI50308.1 50S ribosomal protein L28 [Tepidanaerobacter syntrophicus]HHV82069.1 50S ribosomal protein L28 [Tepidanaerobacter syntrophicus]